MSNIIESLKVEGNVPCPIPADSGKPPPSTARRKPSSARLVDNSSRPVKLRPSLGPRINTEEDLKSIMLQAKSPPILGPTPVTKRLTYLSRIKQLNDGMYNHNPMPNTEAKTAPETFLKLEGKKVDASDQQESDTFITFNANNSAAPPEEELAEKGEHMNVHVRNFKSSLSAKSGKSVRSVQSSKSDPSPSKSMVLPSLTIGASRPMTKGDYITERKEEGELLSLGIGSPNKEAVRGEQEDYEFRFHTPRKLHLRMESREGKSLDSTGNYGSLSLSDLKACLHVNHQNDNTRGQNDIIQGYIQQFKSSRTKTGVKVNAYKMLKSSPRTQMRSPSSKYQFKNVDSYLRFNRHKEMGNLAKTLTNSTIQGEHLKPSYSDTVVLKVVSDLNNPSPSQVMMPSGSNRMPERIRDDILKIKRSGGYSAPKSRNNSAKQTDTVGKEVLQHIIYVPSGQTTRIRLLKS